MSIADPTPVDDAWCRALDELEAGLDRIEAALDAEEPVAAATWSPPSDLGSLPPALQERAADLLARLQDLSDELRAARAASLGEVQRTRLRRDAAAAYSAAG